MRRSEFDSTANFQFSNSRRRSRGGIAPEFSAGALLRLRE
jgi:hypothetical protein